jgi:hypothetical protein
MLIAKPIARPFASAATLFADGARFARQAAQLSAVFSVKLDAS